MLPGGPGQGALEFFLQDYTWYCQCLINVVHVCFPPPPMCCLYTCMCHSISDNFMFNGLWFNICLIQWKHDKHHNFSLPIGHKNIWLRHVVFGDRFKFREM